MKQMKKIVSLLLAAILLLGCNVTSFADTAAKHVITILNEKSGHVYQAYQIFKGDLNEGQNVLSDVEWGSGVDGFGLLMALQSLEESPYATCENAADVAEILAGFHNDSEELDAFAQIIQNYLTLQAAGTSKETESPYTIEVTGDGYYLIQDTKEAVQGDAYTKIILQVAKDVQIQAKADAPTLEKNILEDGQKVDFNDAAVGDNVEYLITSKVPKMDGYEKYFFVIHDILSEGLTFQKDSVEVTIGTLTLDEDDYQVVTENLSDGCGFEIILKDFIQYKEQAEDKIEISYTAVLNEQAVIGNQGNTNKAHLEYSNNPNVSVDGDPENPDKPGVGDGTGTTPDDVTITYLTAIELVKIDDSEDEIRLKGAEFTLKGEKLNQVKKIKGIFKEDANGTYYKRKDGTYTETAPVEDTVDQYESTSVLYLYDTVTEWETVTEQVTERAMVGANGELHFYGLAAGTYEIEEIKAPDGYNLLAQPITVVITMNGPEEVTEGNENAKWKYTLSGAVEQDETVATSGIIELSVVNKAGTVLPSTGGAGVAAFYVIGAVTAAAAIGMNKGKKNEDELC